MRGFSAVVCDVTGHASSQKRASTAPLQALPLPPKDELLNKTAEEGEGERGVCMPGVGGAGERATSLDRQRKLDVRAHGTYFYIHTC